MGSYVEQNLLSGERVLRRAEFHWITFALPVVIIVLGIMSLIGDPSSGGVMLMGLGFLAAIPPIVRRWTTEIAVTNRRIIGKEGLIARRTMELNFDKVESVGVDQSILGRVFNYGTIIVTASGGTRESYAHIADPMALRKAVQEVSQS